MEFALRIRAESRILPTNSIKREKNTCTDRKYKINNIYIDENNYNLFLLLKVLKFKIQENHTFVLYLFKTKYNLNFELN